MTTKPAKRQSLSCYAILDNGGQCGQSAEMVKIDGHDYALCSGHRD